MAASGERLAVDRIVKSDARSTVAAGRIGDRAVTVKQSHLPRGPDLIETAAAVLAAKAARLGDGPDVVPEVLLAAPAHRLLVTETCPGTPLDTLLQGDPGGRDTHLARAGGWLASFVGFERVSDDFGGGFWIRQRDTQQALLPQGPARDLAARLVERMRQEMTRIGNRPITRAGTHGDFRPSKLIFDTDRVAGIGTESAEWIALVRDLARMLVSLEVTCPRGDQAGLSGPGDLEALLANGRLIHPGEVETMLPFFIASELGLHLTGRAPRPAPPEVLEPLCERFLDG